MVRKAASGLVVLFVSLFAALRPAAADELVVRVPGADGTPREEVFDIGRLERLGPVELVTVTPWTEGEHVFRGIPVTRLFTALGVAEGTVWARALNDYETRFTLDRIGAWQGLLAWEMDGRPMPVEEKGPFWIVFPWSDRPELDAREVRSASIWQLVELEVE